MEGHLKIDTDVPPPEKFYKARTLLGEQAAKMEIGHSILTENHRTALRLRDLLRYRFGPKCYTMRKIPEEGWRVWRIK